VHQDSMQSINSTSSGDQATLSLKAGWVAHVIRSFGMYNLLEISKLNAKLHLLLKSRSNAARTENVLQGLAYCTHRAASSLINYP
jgi:hypothetical protein